MAFKVLPKAKILNEGNLLHILSSLNLAVIRNTKFRHFDAPWLF